MLKLGHYQHYKGGEYDLIGIAKHSETLEELVIYRARYGDHEYWVRPIAMFSDEVEINHQKFPRFKYLEQ